MRMSRLDLEDRLSGLFRGVAERITTALGAEPVCAVLLPAESVQIAGAVRGNTDSSIATIVFSIRERLEQHPHFRGRTSLIQIELVEETIVLSGSLPSYYLKQLLQEAIMPMPDVTDIDNRVLVTWPNQ